MSAAPESAGIVRVGAIEAATGGRLTTVGLGSCVAIVLYDDDARVGGVAHTLLPDPSMSRNGAAPGRYVTTAVPALLEAMEALGAARERIYARLAGGASMFEGLLSGNGLELGGRNVEAARRALREADIPVRGEEIGGSRGRSARLDVADGSLVVASVTQADVEL